MVTISRSQKKCKRYFYRLWEHAVLVGGYADDAAAEAVVQGNIYP